MKLRDKKPVIRTFASEWKDMVKDVPTSKRLAAFTRFAPSDAHRHSPDYAAAAERSDKAAAWALYGWLVNVALAAVLYDNELPEEAALLQCAAVGTPDGENAIARVCGKVWRAARAAFDVATIGEAAKRGVRLGNESGITAAVEALAGAPTGATGLLLGGSLSELLYNAEQAGPGAKAETVKRLRESGLALLETLTVAALPVAAE